MTTKEEKVRQLVRSIRSASDPDAERMVMAAIREERAEILAFVERERDESYRAEKIANSLPSGYAADMARDIATEIRSRNERDFAAQA